MSNSCVLGWLLIILLVNEFIRSCIGQQVLSEYGKESRRVPIRFLRKGGDIIWRLRVKHGPSVKRVK